jgi:Ca2+-binding EF-hand superfamily protein
LNVIDKMKKLVRSSDKSLEEQFLEFDKFNTGFITNLEFRAVMRKLNIGLSTYDIDSVLNVCESV